MRMKIKIHSRRNIQLYTPESHDNINKRGVRYRQTLRRMWLIFLVTLCKFPVLCKLCTEKGMISVENSDKIHASTICMCAREKGIEYREYV